jgi:hypothetical protein
MSGSFAHLLETDGAAIADDVTSRLCARTASVFRTCGPARVLPAVAALLVALRRDLEAGGAHQLRSQLPPALAFLGDDPPSYRDLRILGETLRADLHARVVERGLDPAPLAAWCFELALQLGLLQINQREAFIVQQAAEIEIKLAEQRQLSRLVGELREEVREARQLGQYSLLSKLGEGGMGVVYRARHALMRRPTAVKLLPPGRSRKEDLQRFEREVRLTARLSHPNTVTIYDFGRTPEGVFYYAMELLEGGTLEDIVAVGGPLTPARVAKILVAITGALSEAHGIGLIHRDIKPANIMLCEQGGEHDVAKILDFGLVKELGDVGAALSQDSHITGTPYYMAPEAILDPQHLDARADLYALGAVGYFLLTARTVFEGRSSIEVLSHHLHSKPVPPSQRLGAPVPADLEAVILQCLAKTPDGRPSSAAVLRKQLAACADLGGWDLEDARAWWDRHAAQVQARRTVADEISGAKTIDVALHVLGRS